MKIINHPKSTLIQACFTVSEICESKKKNIKKKFQNENYKGTLFKKKLQNYNIHKENTRMSYRQGKTQSTRMKYRQGKTQSTVMIRTRAEKTISIKI